jgi:hypothetical protein
VAKLFAELNFTEKVRILSIIRQKSLQASESLIRVLLPVQYSIDTEMNKQLMLAVNFVSGVSMLNVSYRHDKAAEKSNPSNSHC